MESLVVSNAGYLKILIITVKDSKIIAVHSWKQSLSNQTHFIFLSHRLAYPWTLAIAHAPRLFLRWQVHMWEMRIIQEMHIFIKLQLSNAIQTLFCVSLTHRQAFLSNFNISTKFTINPMKPHMNNLHNFVILSIHLKSATIQTSNCHCHDKSCTLLSCIPTLQTKNICSTTYPTHFSIHLHPPLTPALLQDPLLLQYVVLCKAFTNHQHHLLNMHNLHDNYHDALYRHQKLFTALHLLYGMSFHYIWKPAHAQICRILEILFICTSDQFIRNKFCL